ncbi:hypothetical protein [uncultured Acinetobacter sp.]|uniref:hypothetical protein n=1 Tax=uncultured Acinetobacter sp. TaxID=165433 RepID=UPI0026160566|nr:hypothetical protein [uncultured Acinetobacter sp.]
MANQDKRLSPKVIMIASLGLLIPILLVVGATFAIKSDAKNQALYKQQEAEMMQRIAEREAAEKAASEANVTP